MSEAVSLEGFRPLLSEAVKNDKAVKTLSQTAVLFSNLLVELSIHMEEPSFTQVKEKVLDFMALADEVFRAITPEEALAEPSPEEVTKAQQGTVPSVTSDKCVDPSVVAVLDSLDPSTKSAATSALGINTSDVSQVAQADVSEQTRVRFRYMKSDAIIKAIQEGKTFDTLATELEDLAGLPLSSYEKAIAYVEYWRQA